MDRLRVMTAALVLLFYWVAWAASLLPLGLVLSRLLGGHRGREMGQLILKKFFGGFVWLLRLFGIIRCEYVGFDRLRAQTGAMIIAPNHPALWDAVLVMAEVDRAACVLKAGLMRNPLLFCGSTAAGFISNEPSHQMMRRCIELLKGQERLVFFPEGTRTRPEHGCMNPLTGGLAVIAKNSGAPVWPIFVQTSSRYLSKGWPIWRLPCETICLKIIVGDPVYYPADGKPQEFLEELREQYLKSGCGVVEA